VVLDQIFMDHLIKIISGYSGLDDCGGGMHGLRSEPAREAHFLDDLLRLDVVSGVGIGRRPAHITRPRNAGWHVTRGRDGSGLDGHFAILLSEEPVANNIKSAGRTHVVNDHFPELVGGGVPSRCEREA
jgi:hypothetical protein